VGGRPKMSLVGSFHLNCEILHCEQWRTSGERDISIGIALADERKEPKEPILNNHLLSPPYNNISTN